MRSFFHSWLRSRGHSTRKLWLENQRLERALALARRDERYVVEREQRLEDALLTILDIEAEWISPQAKRNWELVEKVALKAVFG